MTKKKAHPADIADREAVAQASSFNVHLRISPTKKINEPAASLAEAAKTADQLASIVVYATQPVFLGMQLMGVKIPRSTI